MHDRGDPVMHLHLSTKPVCSLTASFRPCESVFIIPVISITGAFLGHRQTILSCLVECDSRILASAGLAVQSFSHSYPSYCSITSESALRYNS